MTAEGAVELLRADRARTAARLAALRGDHAEVVAASRDTNADDEHDPEGATIAFERAQIETLARVSDGSYGVCERCGRSIAPARLEARPTARTCVGCPPIA